MGGRSPHTAADAFQGKGPTFAVLTRPGQMRLLLARQIRKVLAIASKSIGNDHGEQGRLLTGALLRGLRSRCSLIEHTYRFAFGTPAGRGYVVPIALSSGNRGG